MMVEDPELPQLEVHSEGVVLTVQAAPRARRPGIVGLHADALKVAVNAPPVDGAANEAITRFLARWADQPRRSVRILSGQQARRKRILFEGLTLDELRERLTRALTTAPS